MSVLTFCIIFVVSFVTGVVGEYFVMKTYNSCLSNKPLFFPDQTENEMCYFEEKYIIYKLYRGNVVEMEDCKNAIQCHSRLEELSRGENTDLEIRYNFDSGQYEYVKDEKVVDSTDIFY